MRYSSQNGFVGIHTHTHTQTLTNVSCVLYEIRASDQRKVSIGFCANPAHENLSLSLSFNLNLSQVKHLFKKKCLKTLCCLKVIEFLQKNGKLNAPVLIAITFLSLIIFCTFCNNPAMLTSLYFDKQKFIFGWKGGFCKNIVNTT